MQSPEDGTCLCVIESSISALQFTLSAVYVCSATRVGFVCVARAFERSEQLHEPFQEHNHLHPYLRRPPAAPPGSPHHHDTLHVHHARLVLQRARARWHTDATQQHGKLQVVHVSTWVPTAERVHAYDLMPATTSTRHHAVRWRRFCDRCSEPDFAEQAGLQQAVRNMQAVGLELAGLVVLSQRRDGPHQLSTSLRSVRKALHPPSERQQISLC